MRSFFEHRKTGRLTVGGQCFRDGFTLTVTHLGLRWCDRVTLGNPTPRNDGPREVDMRLPAAVLMLVALHTLGFGWVGLWWGPVVTLIGTILLYIGIFNSLLFFVGTPGQPTEQWQWHACEHKAAIVLECDWEPTEENVRRANPVSIRCGTISVVTDFLCDLVLGCWLVQGSLWWSPVFLCSLAARRSTLQAADENARPHLLSQIVAAPVLMVALILERLMVIRTPTAHQIQATAQFLQELHRTHRWVQPPRLRTRTRPPL